MLATVVVAVLGVIAAMLISGRSRRSESPAPAPAAPTPAPPATPPPSVLDEPTQPIPVVEEQDPEPEPELEPEPDDTASGLVREAWIGWLRVAAIVGVILIHVGGSTASSATPGTNLYRVAAALDFSSRWCVPVFVMVSGALLLDPSRYRGDLDFLRRRALRLVPALIFWHAAYLVYRLFVADEDLTAREVTRDVFTGHLFTALYFFWLILGLAMITPLLVPWVAAASRRARLIGAAALCAVPAVMVSTAPFRNTSWDQDFAWTETAVTWFIPYLGFYLLGFALRDVILRRGWLLLAVLASVGGAVLLTWQWGARPDDGVRGFLEHHQPAEAYYSVTVTLFATVIFLCARALIRPDGLLRFMARGWMARLGGALGATTLGVFAGHLLVLKAVLELEWIGGEPAATSVGQLLARVGVVVVVTYAGALVVARIPVLRRLV